MEFNGLGMNLGNLSRLSSAQSRSITAENFTGEKGRGGMAERGFGEYAARELGRGWKVSPAVWVEPGQTFTMADIEGSGAITHMWIAGPGGRENILRIYWDDQENPSVECPLGDFFAMHWSREQTSVGKGPYFELNSLPVLVAPWRGYNCFWEMPFRRRCRITMENLSPHERQALYYQVDYQLTDVPDDCAYFHAQFRRVNPQPYKQDYVILDRVKGQGHYVGTSMGFGINNNRWWGEGEVKFFIDGDGEFPTICGTGTEDYFLGSYNWEVDNSYRTYTSAFAGMHEVYRPDGLYQAQHRHGMYRWHIMDPIRFREDLKVTIQSLGWRSDGRYLPGMHDICSTAFWYQTLPTAPFPRCLTRDELEIL